MENKNTIKKVTGNGTWNSPNGTMYKWEIEMENGDLGQAMTKAQDQTKWVVGKQVTYTKETKGNYTNFKLVEEKPAFGGGSKFEPKDASLIAAQSCLGYACTLNQQSQKAQDTDYILQVAEKFHKWVMSKKTA